MKSAKIIFIHRGKHLVSDFLGNLLTKDDFIFDYRGKYFYAMLFKAFLASFRLPAADVYFVEGALGFWVALFKKIFYPKRKIIILTPDPMFNWRGRSGFKNIFLKFLFNRADYFLPISRLVAEDVKFYSKKPFSIVHYFATVDGEELSKLTPGHNKKNILFMINRPQETGWVKGLDIVLEIFRLLFNKDPGWHLYIIGAGTEKLVLDFAGIDLKRNLHIEGFQNPRDYFKKCPFILSPSRYETFNFGVLEGCAAGQLPIISGLTGIEEFIDVVDKFLIVNTSNPVDYAERLLNLYRLSADKKAALSEKLRGLIYQLRKENTVKEFKEAIEKAEAELGVKLEFVSS